MKSNFKVYVGFLLAVISLNASAQNCSSQLASTISRVTSQKKAPSNTNLFYSSFYKAVSDASSSTGSSNPLQLNPSNLDSKSADKNLYATAVNAFVWGLPLTSFWEKQGSFSTPINQFFLANQIDTSPYIVSPNTSVLYANAFIDLSAGPLQIYYPQTNLYNVLQVMDPYTNVQLSVGSRINACGSVVLYWKNDPNAAKIAAKYSGTSMGIDSPQAWLIGRVAVDAFGPAQKSATPITPYQQKTVPGQLRPALWQSQSVLAGYKIQALSDLANSSYQVTKSTANNPIETSTYIDFYSYLSQAVVKNGLLVKYADVQGGVTSQSGTLYDQSDIFNSFSTIGLTAKGFDLSQMSSAQKQIIQSAFNDARQSVSLVAKSAKANSATNFWGVNINLGQYEPGYQGWIFSAVVAWVGLGANLASDGAYPKASYDVNGNLLNGASKNRYKLDFSQSGLPPINTSGGFWSVSVYDNQNLLYSNTLNNFYINNSQPVNGVYSLGSMQLSGTGVPAVLYLQNSPPSQENLSAWIPVPPGNFNVVIRLYNAVPANSNGIKTILNLNSKQQNSPTWLPPGISPY